MTTDQSYWPLSMEEFTFYNLKKTETKVVNWVGEEIINGIIIDINPNTEEIRRTIFTASTWLQEVGGFTSALTAIFLILVPLFQI